MQATSTTDTIVTGVLTGVLSSFVASLVFIWFINRIRPIFRISNYIARNVSGDGLVTYRVKFINKTRYRAHDIRVSLFRVTPNRAVGDHRENDLHSFIKVPLSKEHIEFLAPFNRSKSDRDAFYAARVRVMEDMKSEWRERNTYYRLEVSGHHSISGTRWCVIKEFANANSIVDGEFYHGADLRVDRTSPGIRPFE
jgi:hypothetical protein